MRGSNDRAGAREAGESILLRWFEDSLVRSAVVTKAADACRHDKSASIIHERLRTILDIAMVKFKARRENMRRGAGENRADDVTFMTYAFSESDEQLVSLSIQRPHSRQRLAHEAPLMQTLRLVRLFSGVLWSIATLRLSRVNSLAHPNPFHRSNLPPMSLSRLGLSLDEASSLNDDDEYCSVVDEFGCEAFENYVQENDVQDHFRWIRVEKERDPSLDVDGPADVWAKIKATRDEQAKYGRCDLYPRRWDYTGREPINGELYSDKVFSVMQFNALAEGLSSGPEAKKPFRVDPDDRHTKNDKKSQFGGFTSIPNPEIVLDFAKRRWRLLELILKPPHDGTLFDLVAMEEIDRYRGFFAPVLSLFGYEGLFMPKTRSPGVRMGWYSDGCCLFWQSRTFALVSETRREYQVGNQIYILATLRHLATGRAVVVAVTHLKASKAKANEKIRCAQVAELLEEVAEEVQRLVTEGETNVSSLILGDFNADPPLANEYDEVAVKKVLDYRLATNRNESSLIASAYDLDPRHLYTTWKIRGSETAKRIIDYIFYAGVECQATLSVPDESELELNKLPGLRHPSDHMMIAAKFRIDS